MNDINEELLAACKKALYAIKGREHTGFLEKAIQRAEREKLQRDRMNERFANRSPSPATADFDLPAPNDDTTDPAKSAEQCQNLAHMAEFACSDKSQCWEPCGELGKSAEHARVCKCDMRTKLVGDGCDVCNPEHARAVVENIPDGDDYEERKLRERNGEV